MYKRIGWLLALAALGVAGCSSGDSGKQQGTKPAAQNGGNVFSAETQALDKAKSVNAIIQQSDQKRREIINSEGQ